MRKNELEVLNLFYSKEDIEKMSEIEAKQLVFNRLKDLKKFKKAFLEYAESIDEIVLEPISAEYIYSVFKNKGKWAGVQRYIYYIEDVGFVSEGRTFGYETDRKN